GLTPVSAAAAAQAVAGARLVVRMGEPAADDRFPTRGAVLTWPTQRGQDGDWYVRAPEPSPLAGALAGVAWDSLPPAAAVSDLALPPTGDSAAVVVLTARLARRGAARPVIVLSQPGGARRAAVAASGLFRWAFRGGASAEAYRAVVAALADWLLTGGEVLRRVAPRGAARAGPAGWRTGPTGELGAARSLVAVCGRDRCVRDGVGVAAPAGPAVMTPLWQRLSRVFGRRDAGAREEAE